MCRKNSGSPDFVTKQEVRRVLRARIRGLWLYYRESQKGNKTACSWCRAEIKKANKAMKIL